MKRFFSIFTIGLCLIFANRSFSAINNFLRAEIIDNTGTTISGEVEYKGWLKTPTSIFFREVGNTGKMYLPKDIRSVTVFHENGSREIYSTYTVAIDFASLDLKKLDSKPEPDLVEKTVFLRHLVNGKLNLYGLVDETDKRHYFVSKDEGVPKELTYRKYYYNVQGPDLPISDLKTSSGVSQVKINSAYKNELYNLMSDNALIKKEQYEKLAYKEKELVDLVSSYNGESTYVRPFEKMVLRPELKAGLVMIDFAPKNMFTGYDFAPKTGPSFGIGLNISIPKTQWSIQNDLRYASYQYKRRLEFSGDDYYEEVSFNFTYLKLQSTARYTFRKGRTEPYIQAGILNGYLIKDEIATKRYFYGDESNLQTIGEPDKLEQGLVFGGGVMVKNIIAGIDYELSNGFAHGSNAKTYFKNIYLSIGYRF